MTILCRKRPSGWYNVPGIGTPPMSWPNHYRQNPAPTKRKVFHRHRPQRGGQVGLRLPETVFRRSGSLLVCIFIPTIIELTRSFQLPLLRKTVFIPQLSEIVSVVKPLGRIRVVIHHTAGQSATGIEQIPFHIQILAFRQTGKKIHLPHGMPRCRYCYASLLSAWSGSSS